MCRVCPLGSIFWTSNGDGRRGQEGQHVGCRKTKCYLGHTSPVEYVKFNSGEDLVIAGSQSGTLKIWDLEAAKIVRTLTGHKSSIRGIDFHPYGEFVASGSLDTNVKLWDVRRKGCIVTLKLWDLTSESYFMSSSNTQPLLTVWSFHPKEFLLATASNDRTVKFWDLETFQLVSTTDAETNGIRSGASYHQTNVAVWVVDLETGAPGEQKRAQVVPSTKT
ncbi:hypothetical protein OS493_039604 [Desmophyllum pertusum]|uniref:Katanin p80 WD40 repeat-containing subunit B1 homolog n=1 Tax=Desmophyllum pertusum TaxID=174260 RepID=A0A9X0CCC6_9CNID|nr:hypothetical protein OS493_039604 [Desmophyllum pertusum]